MHTMGVYVVLSNKPELAFLVDRDVYETIVIGRTWYGELNGGRYYPTTWGNNGAVKLHRIIMNAQSRQRIDHKDTDSLNNLRFNLRVATASQNGSNSIKSKTYNSQTCTSQYKGVYWNRRSWVVGIGVNRKWFYLGSSKDEEEAARIYNRAAREHFGEFARFNNVIPIF